MWETTSVLYKVSVYLSLLLLPKRKLTSLHQLENKIQSLQNLQNKFLLRQQATQLSSLKKNMIYFHTQKYNKKYYFESERRSHLFGP